ncbi:MAG: hypothetical protein RLZZ459_336 [Cyanobacteriota bacterium]
MAHRSANNNPSNEHWEVGMALMPEISFDPSQPPTRALLVLVVDGRGEPRATTIGWPEDPEALLAEAWQEARERPTNGGWPGLPNRVIVPNPELLALLRPLLGAIPADVGSTQGLERAMEALHPMLQEGDEPLNLSELSDLIPSDLVSDNFGDDVNSDDLKSFFEAGVALKQRQPWQSIPSDHHLIQVNCTALDMKNWIACVIGQSGHHQALILLERLRDHERYRSMADEAFGTIPQSMPDHLFLSYEDWEEFSPQFQDDFDAQGWPRCADNTCVIALTASAEEGLTPVNQRDLHRLTATAEAVVHLIDAVPDLAQQWNGPSTTVHQSSLAGRDISLSLNLIKAGQTQPTTAPKRKKERIPAALNSKVESLMAQIDPFCDMHLNDEYRQLMYSAVAALARKRPSPLLSGRENSWCAGVVHAVGMVNFLFDRSETPYCKAPQIYEHFGVSGQTGQAYSKKVRDLLKMAPFEARWALPSKVGDSPLFWMIEVNGLIVDARSMPLEIQIQACAKGLIPYVPAMQER